MTLPGPLDAFLEAAADDAARAGASDFRDAEAAADHAYATLPLHRRLALDVRQWAWARRIRMNTKQKATTR